MTQNEEPHADPADAGPVPDEDASAGAAEAAPDAAGESLDADEALAAAREQAEENYNKYIRLAAEMENLRKRTERDVENAHRFGIERFASELLAVTDSLEMGLVAGENATVDSLLEGKRATLKLLLGALEKHGIEQIDPEGEPFDPQLHEAMTVQPSDTAEPGSVLTVVQKGYQLNGRLLRPARVIVAAEPAATD
jgi:molecular chaperone GrpE